MGLQICRKCNLELDSELFIYPTVCRKCYHECNKKNTINMKKKRKTLGLCAMCGKSNDRLPKTYCKSCKDKKSKQSDDTDIKKKQDEPKQPEKKKNPGGIRIIALDKHRTLLRILSFEF